jgi:hypothetical protein
VVSQVERIRISFKRTKIVVKDSTNWRDGVVHHPVSNKSQHSMNVFIECLRNIWKEDKFTLKELNFF